MGHLFIIIHILITFLEVQWGFMASLTFRIIVPGCLGGTGGGISGISTAVSTRGRGGSFTDFRVSFRGVLGRGFGAIGTESAETRDFLGIDILFVLSFKLTSFFGVGWVVRAAEITLIFLRSFRGCRWRVIGELYADVLTEGK